MVKTNDSNGIRQTKFKEQTDESEKIDRQMKVMVKTNDSDGIDKQK